MSERPPRIWLLLGSRRGDNNQVLALGEALGLPFETRTLSYRPMWGVLLKLFPKGLVHLRSGSRRWLKPPWPDLVIGIGRRSVPVARWIRDKSGERAKLVRLGHPRAPNELFDLVLTTRQYPVPQGDNVVVLPLALNRFRKPPAATAEEQAYLDSRPRPHLLLSLGGTAPMWRLHIAALGEAAANLAERAAAAGGTLIVVGSPRTPGEAWQAVLEATQASGNVAIVASEVRYPVLLGDADEQFVTADSVSMISEAVLTGKPVGLIPVEPDARGRRHFEGSDPASTQVRDPRRFWADVSSRGLVGTVEEPKRGEVEDPVETAVAAVKRRLGSLLE
jgi:mitochondrial fission protein ELM1